MDFLQIYRAMVTAREIDRLEVELVHRGEASFHVSGSGHEGVAILAGLLTDDDWLHSHYRDKAFLLARGLTGATVGQANPGTRHIRFDRTLGSRRRVRLPQ